MIDETVQIGLAFHAWPFSQPIASLSKAQREHIMSRVLAVMPPPTKPPADDDG